MKKRKRGRPKVKGPKRTSFLVVPMTAAEKKVVEDNSDGWESMSEYARSRIFAAP